MIRHLLAAGMIALSPASAVAYINAGFRSESAYRDHLKQEDLAEIARATEAIQRDPRDAVAHLHRGNLYARWTEASAPRYGEALADYDKAIELDPRLAQAYFHRGEVRLLVHRLEVCKTPEWEKAVRLPFPARLDRLRELENTPREAEALADLEKATRLKPDWAEAQVHFAVATRDKAKAIRAVTAACEDTQYKDDICLQLLASLYAESGDFDSAVRWQEKALRVRGTPCHWGEKRLENYRHKKPNEWAIDWYFVK